MADTDLRILSVATSVPVNDEAWKILQGRGVSIERVILAPRRGKLGKYLRDPSVDAAIREAIRRCNPHVVHVGPERVSVRAALRALSDRPDTPVAIERGAIGGLNLLSPIDWMTYFNRRVSKVIVPSYGHLNAWMGRPMLAAAFGAGRVDVIHHPLRLPARVGSNARVALRESLGFPADTFVVGTVCAIRAVKNIEFVARVVAGLKCKALLAVVGSTVEDETVRRIRQAAGDRVVFLGRRPGIETMPAFDVYVTPTRGTGEGFGLATLEAMAAGVPAVTTNVGGSGDLVGGTMAGFALPLRERDWTFTLEMLAADEPLRQRMGQAGRERAEQAFSPERIADQTLAVWRRMANPAT